MNLTINRSTLAEIFQGMAKILTESPYGLHLISSPGHIEVRSTLQQQTLIYCNDAPENAAGEGLLTLTHDNLKNINTHPTNFRKPTPFRKSIFTWKQSPHL